MERRTTFNKDDFNRSSIESFQKFYKKKVPELCIFDLVTF